MRHEIEGVIWLFGTVDEGTDIRLAPDDRDDPGWEGTRPLLSWLSEHLEFEDRGYLDERGPRVRITVEVLA